ncbi:MAG: hypothetical protein ABSC05_31375 [Candidatus Solibacter sp.]|jgi:hypothetical protein
MRDAYAAVLICAVFMGAVFAQDIPTDTEKALATEWKNPTTTLYCLNALRLYTINATPDGGFLPTAAAEKEALAELVKGAAGNEDLYKVAKDTTDFPDTLAKAIGPSPGTVDELFAKAQARIEQIYASAKGKQALNLVQQSADPKLKILQLLEAYPKPVPIDGAYAESLEIFRACYKAGSDRLFKLVSNKILGKK